MKVHGTVVGASQAREGKRGSHDGVRSSEVSG